jgi:hypothetical protein
VPELATRLARRSRHRMHGSAVVFENERPDYCAFLGEGQGRTI